MLCGDDTVNDTFFIVQNRVKCCIKKLTEWFIYCIDKIGGSFPILLLISYSTPLELIQTYFIEYNIMAGVFMGFVRYVTIIISL